MHVGLPQWAAPSRIAALWIYPVKSLDGIQVDSVGFTETGSLLNDRRFCLVDGAGRLVNGKRTPAIHQIRSLFRLDSMEVSLRSGSDTEWTTFNLESGNRSLQEYFSDHLSLEVFVREDSACGFLDDSEAASITLASQATLDQVADWFGWVDSTEAIQRFRPNVIIDGLNAFSEDDLAAQPDSEIEFQLGEVIFNARRLCTRCVVPTRNPVSGELMRYFQRDFVRNRLEVSQGSQIYNSYGHAYLLSVCCTPKGDFRYKRMKVGDDFAL